MSVIQTKQQKRAAFAIKYLEENMFENGAVPSDVAQLIVGMPNMILSNGLGQSMAFLLSKKDKDTKYGKVFDVIKAWLGNEYTDFSGTTNIEFLKKFNSIPQNKYLEAQNEALRLLEWLKRYARAFEAEKKKDK